jgi:hypothetical protein
MGKRRWLSKEEKFALRWKLGGYERDYKNHQMNFKSAVSAVKRLKSSGADVDTIKNADAFLVSARQELRTEEKRIRDAKRILGMTRNHSQPLKNKRHSRKTRHSEVH